MANNNISPTSTTSIPSFVPRIVMMATYTQCIQTPIILVTNNSIQINRSTLNTTSTQTKSFQTARVTQTSPQQILKQFKQTMDLMKLWLLTLLAVLLYRCTR